MERIPRLDHGGGLGRGRTVDRNDAVVDQTLRLRSASGQTSADEFGVKPPPGRHASAGARPPAAAVARDDTGKTVELVHEGPMNGVENLGMRGDRRRLESVEAVRDLVQAVAHD